MPALVPPVSRPTRLAAQPRFHLRRWFTTLSLACIAAATIASSVFLSKFLTDHLLAHDAHVTMEVVQSIADTQNLQENFATADASGVDHALEEFFVHIARLPDVIRANIYGRDQRVLWSSDKTLIGRKLGDNHELEEALEGKLEIEWGAVGADPSKPEHVLLRSSTPRFVELYMPIRSSQGKVIGVVEVYKTPNELFDAIASGTRLVWAIAISGGLLLFVVLWWLVRHTDRLLVEQQERLIESETLAVIGEMTGAIAHGIRNPLASIRTSAELGKDDPAPETREMARDIVNEVDRLSDWLRQLLAYADQRPGDVGPVALGPLLGGCLATFERELQRRNVAVTTDIEVDLPEVQGERVRLGHVFNNLISNAMDAMPSGGNLALTAKRAARGGFVEVTVSDDGVGIPQDQLPRIFAPFFTTKAKGLGLGLPLVKRIVARFGGRITTASETGKGTRIVVSLATSPR